MKKEKSNRARKSAGVNIKVNLSLSLTTCERVKEWSKLLGISQNEFLIEVLKADKAGLDALAARIFDRKAVAA